MVRMDFALLALFGAKSGNFSQGDGCVFTRGREDDYEASWQLRPCLGPLVRAGFGGLRLGGYGFGELCGWGVGATRDLSRIRQIPAYSDYGNVRVSGAQWATVGGSVVSG